MEDDETEEKEETQAAASKKIKRPVPDEKRIAEPGSSKLLAACECIGGREVWIQRLGASCSSGKSDVCLGGKNLRPRMRCFID